MLCARKLKFVSSAALILDHEYVGGSQGPISLRASSFDG